MLSVDMISLPYRKRICRYEMIFNFAIRIVLALWDMSYEASTFWDLNKESSRDHPRFRIAKANSEMFLAARSFLVVVPVACVPSIEISQLIAPTHTRTHTGHSRMHPPGPEIGNDPDGPVRTRTDPDGSGRTRLYTA